MTLIACDSHCIHQDDGYCRLEEAGAVTNNSDNECVHFVRADKKNDSVLKLTDGIKGISD